MNNDDITSFKRLTQVYLHDMFTYQTQFSDKIYKKLKCRKMDNKIINVWCRSDNIFIYFYDMYH